MFARLLLRAAVVGIILTSLMLTAFFALRSMEPGPLLLRLRIGSRLTPLLYEPDTRRELGLTQIVVSGPSLLWSPDGRWLIYRDGAGGVSAYDLTTGQSRVLIGSHPDTVNIVSWSPDSRWLLLREFTQNDLFYVSFGDATESSPRRVDTGISDVLWSTDSRRLYVRDTLGALGQIDAGCLETQTPCIRSLARHHRPADQLAGWMPGGHDLMIVSRAEADGRPQVYSLNPDDGSTRLLLENPLPGAVPAWTADGSALAASLALPTRPLAKATDEPIPGVYVIDRVSGDEQLVWTGIAGELGWTPDGRLLAFDLIARVDQRHSIWIYDRATGSVRNLTPIQSSEAIPIWGIYRGRTLNGAGIIALEIALGITLWLTRRRAAPLPPTPLPFRGERS